MVRKGDRCIVTKTAKGSGGTCTHCVFRIGTRIGFLYAAPRIAERRGSIVSPGRENVVQRDSCLPYWHGDSGLCGSGLMMGGVGVP